MNDQFGMVVGLLAEYAKAHPWLLVLSLLALFIIPVQDILIPHLTGRMVNAIKDGRPLAKLFLLVVVVLAIIQIALVGADLLDAKNTPAIQSFFRQKLFACVMRQYDATMMMGSGDAPTGDLLARFINLPYTMAFWYDAGKSMIPYFLVYIGAAIYFARIDAVLCAAMVVVIIALAVVLFTNIQVCTDVSAGRDRALNGVQESIDDTLRNLPAVYAADFEPHELALAGDKETLYQERYFATSQCALRIRFVLVPLIIGLVGITLWRCNHLCRAKRTMSTGTFVSVFLIVLYLMNSMIRMTMYGKNMVYHWGIVNTSAGMLQQCYGLGTGSTRGIVMDREEAKEAKAEGFGLSNVSYHDVFRNVSFHVRWGERVALTGRIGSGKSTILRLLLRLIEPTSGVLYLDGRPYSDLSFGYVRSTYGYIPQSPTLFDRSVYDNIVYGLEDHRGIDERQVWEAADALGARDALEAIGLWTQAGKNGSRLSGGQRLLVWALRTLVKRPRVLLLDEPTAALDAESKRYVYALIDAIGTVLAVTHDEGFAKSFATRVLTL